MKSLKIVSLLSKQWLMGIKRSFTVVWNILREKKRKAYLYAEQALDVECQACKIYREWNDELRDEVQLLRGKIYGTNDKPDKIVTKAGKPFGGITTRRRRIHDLELRYQRLANANTFSSGAESESTESVDESGSAEPFAE